MLPLVALSCLLVVTAVSRRDSQGYNIVIWPLKRVETGYIEI